MRKDTALLLGLAAFTFLLHMLVSAFTDYGYFIDEFYYIACSRHLAFGYVDHPPLSIFLLAINRWLLGDSLPALRFLPSLAAGAMVFFTGLIARKFAGGLAAQGMAALGAIIAPVYLIFGGVYSMNAFELLLWTMIVYLVIRMIQEDNPKLWLLVGLLLGLGLETKHTMVLYAIGLGAGMLLTPARRYLRNRWFAYGCLLAFALLLPNIVWQIANGFPSLEFYRNAMVYKNIPTGPIRVIVGQIMIVNPVTLPLWLSGLVFFFVIKGGKNYRAFGWCFAIILVLMIISESSRPDRISSIYTVLFAAGAVMIEQFAAKIHSRWPVIAASGLIAIGGLVYAPISVPILPPATLVRYMSAIGFSLNIERGKSSALPQWFADRFGWKELAAEVGTIYHDLRPDLRQNCVIIAGSYGQAGALEFYSKQFDLPPVYSTHNSYFLWGPPPDSAKTYIGVLVPKRDMLGFFHDVDIAGLFSCEYCMNYESEIPIYIARRPREPVTEVWPRIKHYE
jgi:4-amino-4-deoxy-L-arabinose transferase-like glycosyltransferase